MREKLINSVRNNDEKQVAYRVQLGKYKKALHNGFYFEAMLIVYAMIEDRMRAFLYHIGALRREDDSKMNVKQTKSILRRLYYGSDENAAGKHIDINKISVKSNLIRSTLSWAIEYNGTPDNHYLALLKSEYESCVDIGGLMTVLDEINHWCDYRNEIIHGLLNKNVDSVSLELKNKIENGMAYARFLDCQVKSLKTKDYIRLIMRIKS